MEYTKYTPTREFLTYYYTNHYPLRQNHIYYLLAKRTCSWFCLRHGDTALAGITSEDINNFFQDLKKNHSGINYIRQIYSCFRQPFDYAMKNGILENNPFDNAAPAAKPTGRIHIHEFTQEEIKRIFQALNQLPVSKNLVKLAFYTGLHNCELLPLTWDCLDPVAKTLLIHQHMKVIGKFNTANTHILPGDINGTARTIILPDLAVKCLADQKKWQKALEKDPVNHYSNPDNYIFTNQAGHVYTPILLTRQMNQLKKTSQVKNLKFCNIRHHYAVTAAKAGIDINTLRAHLGLRYAHEVIQYWTEAHDRRHPLCRS